MSRVAAVRKVRGGWHQTQVQYIWTGRLTEFRFVALCSVCGELLDAPDEGVAWSAANTHGKFYSVFGSGL